MALLGIIITMDTRPRLYLEMLQNHVRPHCESQGQEEDLLFREKIDLDKCEVDSAELYKVGYSPYTRVFSKVIVEIDEFIEFIELL